MSDKTSEQVISIPAIDIRTAAVEIVGDSPLIMNKVTNGRDAKDPFADFISSMYWLDGEPEDKTPEGFAAALEDGARFRFPSAAVKAAAVAAAYRTGLERNMASLKGAFQILGEFVEIHGTPIIREDMVRGGIGVADIRYRGEFPEWWSVFTVRYNAAVLSVEHLVNMLNMGGFAGGIGEWRVEKGGTFGAFHVGAFHAEREE